MLTIGNSDSNINNDIVDNLFVKIIKINVLTDKAFCLEFISNIEMDNGYKIAVRKNKITKYYKIDQLNGSFICDIQIDKKIYTNTGNWDLLITNGFNYANLFLENELKNLYNGYKYKLIEQNYLIEIKNNENYLFIKTTKIINNNKMNVFPIYVNKVVLAAKMLIIEGAIFDRIKIEPSNNVNLLIRKRKADEKNDEYIYKLDRYDLDKWKILLDVNILKTGIWDFYLKVDEDIFRIKSYDLDEYKDFFIFKDDLFLNIISYQTLKGSFSIEITNKKIELDNINIEKGSNKYEYLVSGIINTLNVNNYIKDIKVLLLDDKKVLKLKKDIDVIENYPNKLYVKFKIDYKLLIRENLARIHIYFSINNEGLLRVKINDKSIENNSLLILEDKKYYAYLYKTIHGNLSIRYKKISMYRDVYNLHIDKTKILFRGITYLNDSIDCSNFEKYLTVKQRNSNREKVFQMVFTDKKKTNFIIKIPLSNLLDFNFTRKETLDLFINYRKNNLLISRKLGKNIYEYSKDAIISRETFKVNNNYIYHYFVYSPYGNYKLEMYKINRLKYFYITYFKDIYKKIFNNKNVWIIGEREDTAQDTGFYFFKFCLEKYPKMKIYYAIESSSKDLINLSKYGNKVLYIGSLKHFIISSISNIFISSHDIEYILPLKSIEFDSYKNGIRVFLQHGILGRRNVEYYKEQYKYPFNIFCVSSYKEKQMVIEKMGYSSDEVKITGLTRYDNLFNNKKSKIENKILIIPTWRVWLTNSDTFKESEYFNRYLNILKDKKLHKLLEENNTIVNFYPHYRIQPFIEYFDNEYHRNINIKKLGTENVQDLLLSHDLMITDYSSVSIDFNYLGKPVIFYHFDFERFFKDGILRPKDETFFGDITSEHNELITFIENKIKGKFKESEFDSKKKAELFYSIDNRNCERVYNEIKNFEKNK